MDEKGDKYLSHDIQNKLISIRVLRGVANDRMRGYYSITADEYCNISNKTKNQTKQNLLYAFHGYTWMTWK